MRETEPLNVTQGEQVEWSRCFDDYPATEWTLAYRFRGPGTGFNINATADGTDFVTELTAVVSAAAAVGDWIWQIWVTNIADTNVKYMVETGTTAVKRGFVSATLTAVETRTPAKIMLDTLDAALLAAGSSDHIEYEITTPAGSRKVKRESRKDVLEQRKYWATIVANERAKEKSRRGGGFGTQVKVRMIDE